jgi:hypothetical protein
MRNSASLLVLCFGLSYYLIERIGLFSSAPVTVLDVLYSIPFLSASLLFLIATLVTTIKTGRNMKISGWIYVTAVMLLIAGLWLSYFTRFSGEAVVTEGQTFYSGHRDYVPETMYRGLFAQVPDIGLKLDELIPEISRDQKDLKGLKGTFSLFSANSDGKRDVVISSGLPSFLDGAFFRIRDMGYSPRYVLKSDKGRILDSSFVFMKLFPPGSEDNFRLLSPLTYYIRYYPDGTENLDESHLALRIVRNKDIVFNDTVRLSEDAVFEKNRISFDEVRTWTRLSIKRDWGEVVALAGLLLGLLNITMGFIAGRK